MKALVFIFALAATQTVAAFEVFSEDAYWRSPPIFRLHNTCEPWRIEMFNAVADTVRFAVSASFISGGNFGLSLDGYSSITCSDDMPNVKTTAAFLAPTGVYGTAVASYGGVTQVWWRPNEGIIEMDMQVSASIVGIAAERVFMHELLHGLGCAHTYTYSSAIMWPFLQFEPVAEWHYDDMRCLTYLYKVSAAVEYAPNKVLLPMVFRPARNETVWAAFSINPFTILDYGHEQRP